MNEDAIVTQLGLLFTTFRYARRALEDIERNTAKYAGISFAPVLAAGPKFGAPPLFNGALKVYIVNINDLTASSGGGLLEGLLGGVGRFIGGLFGGLVGGTIGGAALPYNLLQLAKITDAIHKIVDRVNEMLPGIKDIIADVKDLMKSGKGAESAAATPAPATPSKPMDWEKVLGLGTDAVRGLILLIPIVIGALAALIVRLDSIKLAIVDLLEFALRYALMLRGVLLVVIFDTVAALARLAAGMLSAAAVPVGSIITSVFNIVGALAELATDVLRTIGPGLAKAINDITDWLFNGLGNLLLFIGETRVFRLIQHVVQILPLVLPALIRFRDPEGKGPGLSKKELSMLEKAGKLPIPGLIGPGGGKAGTIARFPDISTDLPKPGDWAALMGKHGATVSSELTKITGNASKLLTDEATKLHNVDFQKGLDKDLENVGKQATKLTESLQKAKKEMEESPTKTGMEDIAKAYEDWLSKGGFTTLMKQVTSYIQHDPTLLKKAGEAAVKEEPKATVEIDQVVIEIAPPVSAAESAVPHAELEHTTFMTEEEDFILRGGVPEQYASLA